MILLKQQKNSRWNNIQRVNWFYEIQVQINQIYIYEKTSVTSLNVLVKFYGLNFQILLFIISFVMWKRSFYLYEIAFWNIFFGILATGNISKSLL